MLVSKIGLHYIGFPEGATEEEVNTLTKQMLFRRLNIRRMVAFVGSGISKAYGYKGWDGLTRKLVRETQNILDKNNPRIELDHSRKTLFDGYLKKRKSSIPRAERNLLMLGSCDEVLRQHKDAIIAYLKKLNKQEGGIYELHTMVKEEIKQVENKRKEITPDNDPLRHLIEGLRIQRFITTNYDVEIERALVTSLDCPARQLLPNEKALDPIPDPIPGDYTDTLRTHGPIAQSLKFDVDHPEALVHFAVAAPGYEVGVFHLHGVASKPESLIVTEYDYQRAYLQDDTAHRFYREALDLLFSGNPILFVGMGMEEADLLRPLRQFVSEHYREAVEWPFFALMEKPEYKAIELRKYLYTRFGIKVLYYEATRPQRTRRFCEEVDRLSEEWKNWWDGWQEKPAIRKPEFYKRKANVMVHHSIRLESEQQFDLCHDEKQVKDALENEPFAVMLLGTPGAGKGMLGIRLVTDEETFPGAFTKRFYGTTHFTNEFLSTIDAAGSFLLDGKGGTKDSFDRFQQGLLDHRHLVVIGGLERLLIPTRATYLGFSEGRPINREVERFLGIVQKVGKSGPSRIVLTSSIWPKPLKKDDVKPIELWGVGSRESFLDHPSYNNFKDKELLKRFHHAVKGHLYAISVVARVLETIKDKNKEEKWLRGLVSYLTAIAFPRREEEVIGATIKKLRELQKSPDCDLMDLLQRVAFFGTPVEAEDVVASYVASYTEDADKKNAIAPALESLNKMKLLLPIEATEAGIRRYTAHTVVRAYVLHALGSLPETPAEPQRLMLSDFASEVTRLHPGAQAGHQVAIKSADALLKRAEEQGDNPTRGIVRAAFGLIRSRWTTLGISRLNHLPIETRHALFHSHIDAFQCRMARLLNVIREDHKSRPSWHTEPDDMDQIVKPDAMLYADELSWLYNELGLAAYVQGALHDAYALFRTGQDINRVAERWGYYGQRWLQSEINLALVELERAQISRARYHLENALSKNKDKQEEARASGYLALVHHLSGNYTRAERLYRKAIKVSRKFENFRGVSLFSWHSSDLQRLLGRPEKAERQINESIAAAEAGRHPDLLHYARVAAVNLKRSSPTQSKAVTTGFLGSALDFAQKVGIPKLKADAHRVQGLIALDQGETQLAGRLAIKCLGIASLSGMRLRLTSSLVLLGQVAIARGNWVAAAQILHSAIELAQRQGYTVQSEKARQELTKIPYGANGR